MSSKVYFISVLALLLTFTVNAQRDLSSLLKRFNSGDVPYTSVQELRMNQFNDNVLILDARETEEYEVSHIQNSFYVGYNDFQIASLNSIAKDSNIVVYCSLGIRSENIGIQLQNAGFINISNLYGGIFEWKNAGYPVFNSKGIRTEKVHAYSRRWAQWLENVEKIY